MRISYLWKTLAPSARRIMPILLSSLVKQRGSFYGSRYIWHRLFIERLVLVLESDWIKAFHESWYRISIILDRLWVQYSWMSYSTNSLKNSNTDWHKGESLKFCLLNAFTWMHYHWVGLLTLFYRSLGSHKVNTTLGWGWSWTNPLGEYPVCIN